MAKYLVSRIVTVAIIALSGVAPAAADDTQVFPGPYSSWSPTQKAQAAQILNQASISTCQTYVDKATTSKGAQFEALACEAAYFVNHTPPDYPSYDMMKSTALSAYRSAQAAGVNPPNFLSSPP
jgi:hypothetical protein